MQINSLSLAMPKMAYKNPNIQTHTNLNKAHPTNQTNLQNQNFGMKFSMTPEVQKNLISGIINLSAPGKMSEFVNILRKLVKDIEPIYKGWEVVLGMNPNAKKERSDKIIYVKYNPDTNSELDNNKYFGDIPTYTTKLNACVNSGDIKCNYWFYSDDGWCVTPYETLKDSVLSATYRAVKKVLHRNLQKVEHSPQEIQKQYDATIDLLEQMCVPKKQMEEYTNTMQSVYETSQKIIEDKNDEEKNMAFLASITT